MKHTNKCRRHTILKTFNLLSPDAKNTIRIQAINSETAKSVPFKLTSSIPINYRVIGKYNSNPSMWMQRKESKIKFLIKSASMEFIAVFKKFVFFFLKEIFWVCLSIISGSKLISKIFLICNMLSCRLNLWR